MSEPNSMKKKTWIHKNCVKKKEVMDLSIKGAMKKLNQSCLENY